MHTIHLQPSDVAEVSWLTATREELAAMPSASTPVVSPIIHKLKVGIRWAVKADFDLYVRPSRNLQELYFGHSKTAEGLHMKDFIDAPPGVQGFESVQFEVPVDVFEASIAINLYSGELTEDAEVEVRVQADEKVAAKVVRFKAGKGSRGKTSQGQRAKDPTWAVVDLAALLGVDRNQVAQKNK